MKVLVLVWASLCAFAAPAHSGAGVPSKEEMKSLATAYLRAFDAHDEAALSRVVTEEYFGMVGGKEALREQWGATKSPGERRVDDVTVKAGEVGAYLRFRIRGPGKADEAMGDHEWFHVVRVDGAWRINRPESDFAPEE